MKLNFFVLFIVIACISENRSIAQVTADFTADRTSGCTPLTGVQFTDQSTPTGNTTWAWTLGNGATSTLQNPVATYNTSGTYTVTLIATRNGVSSTKSMTITVFKNPVANFSTIDGVTKGCTDKTFRFTSDLSTPGDAAITSYKWLFGDGTSSTKSNEDHAYAAENKYEVSLTVTDLNGCWNTNDKTNYIDVASLPVVSFSANPQHACKLPTATLFTNTSRTKGNAEYLWNGGGSFVGTTKDVTFTFTSYNTYTIKLTVTDTTYHCSSINQTDYPIVQTQAIGTIKQGSKTLTYSGDNVCAGPVNFSSTSLPLAGANSWDFDGVASFSFSSGQYSFNTAGTHNVSLVSYSDYCTDTLKWTFNVEKVVPEFTMAPDKSCMPSSTVTFTNISSVNAATFTWKFGNGFTTTVTSPLPQTFTVPGDVDDYVIHQAVSFPTTLFASTISGCKDSVTHSFIIKRPTALFTADTLSGCANLKVNFSDQSQSDSAIIYHDWTFGDGTTSHKTTEKTEQHTYTAAGTYNAQLTITNKNNCTDASYTIPIKVGTPPIGGFTVSPASPVCQSALVTIANIASPADFWQYTINGISIPYCSDVNSPSFTFKPDVGTLTIKQNVGYNGCFSQTTKTITNNGPIASFTYDIPDCNSPYTYKFTGTTKGTVTSFQWLVDGAQVSTGQSPSYTFSSTPANKDYTVKFIVIGPSCSDTATQIVRVRQKGASFTTSLTDACAFQTVTFTGSASQPLSEICRDTYLWDFNDTTPVIHTNIDPINHTFKYKGSYKVLLSAIHDNGCVDTVSHRFRIYKPKAVLAASPNGGCRNTQITFTNSSQIDVNPLLTLYMDYGDNSHETSAPKTTFTHLYGPVNLYTPYLKVTDSKGCYDSTFVTIGIANPIVNIQPLVLPQTCVNSTITFIQDADAPDNVKWDFGDGTISTLNASSIDHIYTSEGDFTAKIKVTKFGCSDSSSILMQLQKADASFTVSDSVVYCPQKPILFTHTTPSKFILSGEWDTGDTKFPYDTTLHYMDYLYKEPGIYTAQLSITTGFGCTDFKTKKIKILSPGAKFDILPKQACKKELITFTMHDTLNLGTYNWDFGDGTGDNTNLHPIASHRYVKGGKIKVYLNINNPDNSCPRSIVDSLTVDTLTAKFSVVDTAGCTEQPVLFTNQSTYSTSQVWNFSDGPVVTEFSPQHTFNVGTYPVTLVAKSLNACLDTARRTMTVTKTPGITVSLTSCANNHAQLHATGGNYVNWLPKEGLDDPASYDPIATPVGSGSVYYKATVTNIDGGCTKTDSVQVIRPSAKIKITYPNGSNTYIGQQLLFVADSLFIGQQLVIIADSFQYVETFHWKPATYLSCADCKTPTAKPLESITYYLVLTEPNHCFTDSLGLRIPLKIDSVMKFYAPDAFKPGDEKNGLFKIYSHAYMELLEFKIYNRWGNLVFSSTNGMEQIGVDQGYSSKDGWDGKYQGNDQPLDTYVWVVSARMFGKDGASIIKNKGHLLLLR